MSEPYAAIESADQPPLTYSDSMSLMVACAGAYSGGRPLKLGEPCTHSELSRNPGYRNRRAGLVLELSGDELQRLILAALTPDEVSRLRARHGLVDELSTELYAADTRAALEPKVRVPTEPAQ
ncbi:MAG: hypothetical protein P8011_04005 [Acidihalobacter sp.]|uniref:hypothetical protein n=1 Tax=Acidihalobacter sp. TaxID=1872108 RepID=UPI00307F79C1